MASAAAASGTNKAATAPARGAAGDTTSSTAFPSTGAAGADHTVLPGGSSSSTGDDLTASLSSTRRRKRRKPGTTWDGRVSNLTLAEYRELKWSLDASYSKVERRGPSFSCRPAYLQRVQSTGGLLHTDVMSAFDKVKPKSQSFSMGRAHIDLLKDKSPGPNKYTISSTMNPVPHPTKSKSCGSIFGKEILQTAEEVTPAPGDYDPNAFKRGGTVKRYPSYSCQGREAWAPYSLEAPKPGPGEYEFPKMTRTGKRMPVHWTAQGKTAPIQPARGDSRRTVMPGAPHYNPPGAVVSEDPFDTKGYAHNHHAPKMTFSKEPRGLL